MFRRTRSSLETVNRNQNEASLDRWAVFTGQVLRRRRPQAYRRIVDDLPDPTYSIRQIAGRYRVSENTVEAIKKKRQKHPTHRLEIRCSIRLSPGKKRVRADKIITRRRLRHDERRKRGSRARRRDSSGDSCVVGNKARESFKIRNRR
jgi:hypothetical protein